LPWASTWTRSGRPGGRSRPCLDWTERRSHLAGGLAAAVTIRLIDLGWFARRTNHGRALRLTDKGRTELVRLGCRLG
jgi:hypothetical protein